MANYTKLNNQVQISVIDQNGEELEMRELYNSPIVELYPEQDVCRSALPTNTTTNTTPPASGQPQSKVLGQRDATGMFPWAVGPQLSKTLGKRTAILDRMDRRQEGIEREIREIRECMDRG
jgi:hypothetical protein